MLLRALRRPRTQTEVLVVGGTPGEVEWERVPKRCEVRSIAQIYPRRSMTMSRKPKNGKARPGLKFFLRRGTLSTSTSKVPYCSPHLIINVLS